MTARVADAVVEQVNLHVDVGSDRDDESAAANYWVTPSLAALRQWTFSIPRQRVPAAADPYWDVRVR